VGALLDHFLYVLIKIQLEIPHKMLSGALLDSFLYVLIEIQLET